MTVECSHCEQEWESDPALEVACPTCGTEAGRKCRRPSGHPCSLHASRDKKALREVEGYERCPGVPEDEIEERDEEVETQQIRLSALTDGGVELDAEADSQ